MFVYWICGGQVQEGGGARPPLGGDADLSAADPADHHAAPVRRYFHLSAHPETDPEDLPRTCAGVCLYASCLLVCMRQHKVKHIVIKSALQKGQK